MVHIKPVRCESENLGGLIKQTKKLYIWEFYLDDELIIIEFFYSLLTRKRRIEVNKILKYEDIS